MTPFTKDDCIPDKRSEALLARLWLSMPSLTAMSISTPPISLYWWMADTVRLAAEVRRYGTCLADGKRARWERYDVLGVIKPEKMPDWAKEAVDAIRKQEKAKKPHSKEER